MIRNLNSDNNQIPLKLINEFDFLALLLDYNKTYGFSSKEFNKILKLMTGLTTETDFVRSQE